MIQCSIDKKDFMMKKALLLGALAVAVLATDVQAGCGLFRGGLFGGRFRASQSCGSYQSYQSYQSFRSYSPAPVAPSYQYESYQFRSNVPATPRAYPAPQAPLSCPTGGCPVSYSPSTSASIQVSYIIELNQLRARYGRGPVVFDQIMYNDAITNNQQQRMRGMGHFFMGRARRQNAAEGQSSATQAIHDWITSPGHLEAMLDPSITMVAIAGDGPYWTFSAR